MGTETIELLKPYKPEKMLFPAGFQQKFDGVPAFITRADDNEVRAYTRQGEVITSINHVLNFARLLLGGKGEFIVGELHHPDLPFKEISGKVRRQNEQAPELSLLVFDFGLYVHEFAAGWEVRRQAFVNRLADLASSLGMALGDLPIRSVPTITVRSSDEAEAALDHLMQANPQAEGGVLHSWGKIWSPGKRVWLCQKMKPEPTIDLRVAGYEEAISKDGKPLGMVGRINAEFTGADGKTKIIGVGPGSMDHNERRREWLRFASGKFYLYQRIAEIKYMRDDTYDALRQPTFKRWREDKAVPNTGLDVS